MTPAGAPKPRVRVYEHGRLLDGTDGWFGPCSTASLGQQPFFRDPEQHGLHLRGGGDWRLVGNLDISPRDGSKPYSRLTLKRL